MACTTVEKSSSLVYCLTDRRSKSSSRGSGRRAFSSKARVMTDRGVPWAKRSKRGCNSMPGSLGGLGDNTQTTYREGSVPRMTCPPGLGVDRMSTCFSLSQVINYQAIAANVKLMGAGPEHQQGEAGDHAQADLPEPPAVQAGRTPAAGRQEPTGAAEWPGTQPLAGTAWLPALPAAVEPLLPPKLLEPARRRGRSSSALCCLVRPSVTPNAFL